MHDRNDIPRSRSAFPLSDDGLSSRGPETDRRLLLQVIRLMARDGIKDASAAAMLLGRFGRAYRRPLVLIRALMLELARTSHRQIVLAPPRCGRVTRDEAVILRLLARSQAEFAACHEDTGLLLGRADALGAATCFQAVSACFADLGAPFD